MGPDSKPHFEAPIQKPIERYPDGEIFKMQSVDESSELRPEDLEQVAEICNEGLVYDTLFRGKFEGRPYTSEDAKGFTDWAKQGWNNNDKFVFLIRDPQNRIVGAIDIKSNNTEAAEIGYWASSTTPGIMTNAVKALCDIAKDAGYKQLYGLTVPNNERSQKVLLRAGFSDEGLADRKGKEYLKFTRDLLV